MALTCDIVGNDPLYLISNLRYRIVATGEAVKITLPQSAYSSSVVVKTINSDGSFTTLTQGTNYVFTGCQDTDTEALVRAAYPTFAKNLYNGFYVLNTTFGSNTYIDLLVSYQSVFPNILSSAIDQETNPGGPVLSTELLRQMVEDLIYLKGLVNSGESETFASATTLPVPLETDYTGELEDNYIQNEDHQIDTVNGKIIIRPANGSFFKSGVTVKDKDGNNLVLDTDYTIRGLDLNATKVCENTSGVYRFIVLTLTSSYVGKVTISYHAFGGEVSIRNLIAIQSAVQELQDYINQGSFLTAKTVGGTVVIQSILERLKTLDRYFRSLNMSGYRDMSNTFIATNDTNSNDGMSHWYRVAYLYRQASSANKFEVLQLTSGNIASYTGKTLPLSATYNGTFTDTVITADHVGSYVIGNSIALDRSDYNYFSTYTKDSVRLKLRLEKTGVFFDFFIFANVKTGVLDIRTMEADTDNGSADPSNYKSLSAIVIPEFRLVWRKDGDFGYGAVLQVKVAIPEGEDHEIIHVENHNKAGMGGWLLRGDINGTDNVEPEDETVVLPDIDHTWVSGGSSATYGSVSVYPSSTNGTLVWAGSIPMSWMDGSYSGTRVGSLNSCLNHALNMQSIKNICILAFDRYNGTYVSGSVAVKSILPNDAHGPIPFDVVDNCVFNVTITNASSTKVDLSVISFIGTKSLYLERFDLRQILINKEVTT